jgi:hypothetical protein
MIPGQSGCIKSYRGVMALWNIITNIRGIGLIKKKELFDPEINKKITLWDMKVSIGVFSNSFVTIGELELLAVNSHIMGRDGTKKGEYAIEYLGKIFSKKQILLLTNIYK